jgi:hypothetical protein
MLASNTQRQGPDSALTFSRTLFMNISKVLLRLLLLSLSFLPPLTLLPSSSLSLTSVCPSSGTGVKCSDIYDIYTEKRIGKGSYGSVYYCKHKKSGEEFACKVHPLSLLPLPLLIPVSCTLSHSPPSPSPRAGHQCESNQLALSPQAALGDRHHEGPLPSLLPPPSAHRRLGGRPSKHHQTPWRVLRSANCVSRDGALQGPVPPSSVLCA